MIEQVEVEHVGEGRYRLTVPFAIDHKVEVVASHSPDEIGQGAAVYPVGTTSVQVECLQPALRHYFHVRINGDVAGVAAHRHVPLEGAPNFRDFGGYSTQDGRQVRWGRLYRSGMLSKLSLADTERLKGLGLRLVCDFRREDEQLRDPSRWLPDARPRTESLPLSPGDQGNTLGVVLDGRQQADIGAETVAAAMEAINREFVLDQSDVYSRLLHLVVDEAGPVLIHCAAGKDRTGFGAAIILMALGVPESSAMQDYLLTSRYFDVKKGVEALLGRYELGVPREVVVPILEARQQYLRAALDTIQTEYGSFQAYLREGLGFDESAQRELKQRLLI